MTSVLRDVSNTLRPPQNHSFVKELNLSGNELKTLPSWITECVKLEKLDISNNSLLSVGDQPPTLDKLKNLKSLRVLKANKISLTSIPDCLQNLKLERLELKDNILYTLPHWLFPWAKENKTTLCFDNNRRLHMGFQLKLRAFRG